MMQFHARTHRLMQGRNVSIYGLPSPAAFRALHTANHKILTEDNESTSTTSQCISSARYDCWRDREMLTTIEASLHQTWEDSHKYFHAGQRLVTNLCGHTILPLLIALKQMASLKELLAESMKARLLPWCSVVFLMSCGMKPWSVVVIRGICMMPQLMVKPHARTSLCTF